MILATILASARFCKGNGLEMAIYGANRRERSSVRGQVPLEGAADSRASKGSFVGSGWNNQDTHIWFCAKRPCSPCLMFDVELVFVADANLEPHVNALASVCWNLACHSSSRCIFWRWVNFTRENGYSHVIPYRLMKGTQTTSEFWVRRIKRVHAWRCSVNHKVDQGEGTQCRRIAIVSFSVGNANRCTRFGERQRLCNLNWVLDGYPRSMRSMHFVNTGIYRFPGKFKLAAREIISCYVRDEYEKRQDHDSTVSPMRTITGILFYTCGALLILYSGWIALIHNRWIAGCLGLLAGILLMWHGMNLVMPFLIDGCTLKETVTNIQTHSDYVSCKQMKTMQIKYLTDQLSRQI